MINTINSATQNIEQKTSTVVPFKSPPPGDDSKVYKLRQVEEQKPVEDPAALVERDAEEKKDPKISQAMLDELASDIETLHSIGLSFAQHEDTGRTMVEVMDKDTKTLIRQIPSEDVLNMAAKMDEMIGMLFDEKV